MVVSELFDLSMPWYAFVLRGVACYVVLLVLLRLTGKRSFGEMSPFDIVVLILVGGALRSAIVGRDESLLGPLIAVAAILATDNVFAIVATYSPSFNRLLEGRSALLVERGSLVRGALRRHHIPEEAFARALRMHGMRSVDEVDEARLEANGNVTMIPARAEDKR